MSTLVTSNISDGTTSVGTGYVVNGSAKAWVNFNGTGTVAIRDSINVSSLTDYATGNYGSNFTNAFNAADYVAFSGNGDSPAGGDVYTVVSQWTFSSASSFRAYAYTGAFSTAVDSDYGNYSFLGELA